MTRDSLIKSLECGVNVAKIELMKIYRVRGVRQRIGLLGSLSVSKNCQRIRLYWKSVN